MILPERVLGKAGREVDLLRRGERADVVAHFLVQFLAQRVVAFFAGVEGDEGVDRLALDVVRKGDDRGFGDLGMGDQRAFDFGGADAVAGDVDHIVDSAGDPVIAVLVAAAAVAGEIEARDRP